jgi:hypothetical protein
MYDLHMRRVVYSYCEMLTGKPGYQFVPVQLRASPIEYRTHITSKRDSKQDEI